MSKVSEHVVLDLIATIYDAALEPARWNDLLRGLCHATHSTASALFVQDHECAAGSLSVGHGYDPTFARSYQEHFAAVNVWLKRMESLTKPGDIRNSQEACTERELVRTEYYNDWLRPQNLFYGFGATLARSGSTTTNITAMRPRRPGGFGAEETRLLRVLIPHMQRALELHRKVVLADASLKGLDRLATGFVIVDRQTRILFINRMARQLVAKNDGIRAGASGVLTVRGEEGQQLAKSVHQAWMAASGYASEDLQANLKISRPSGKRPYSILVVPVGSRDRAMLFGGLHEPVAALLISDPEAQVQPDPAALKKSFGLTRAEAALACRLTEGKSLEQAAAELSRTLHTVRSQLKSILRKTGANRQSELIRLILMGIADLRLSGH